MGLLDDAIREHLELKRLRGVDPGAVAREEQDALGPARYEARAEQGGPLYGGPKVTPDAEEPPVTNSETTQRADSSTAGQETIEINMEAELAAGADSQYEQDATQPERAAPVAHPSHVQASEESIEWDVPSDRGDGPVGAAGSHGGATPSTAEEYEAVEHVEDVLEETPDFLRDTPEQERLWFEQRPPRDFDFNE
jgi:hypothetical protein